MLEQYEVEQLLLDLVHIDGFLLDIVMVPSAHVAQQLEALVREQVASRRSEPVFVHVVGPNAARARPLDPVTSRELVDDLLRPLLVRRPRVQPGFSLTWLDASTAREMDRDAWAHFFARLNERRDAIIAALGEPLLIVIPSLLESTLARNAPDAWSARTGIYRVKLAAVETHEFDLLVPAPAARSAAKPPRRFLVTLGISGEVPLSFTDGARATLLGVSSQHLLGQGATDQAIAAARGAVEHAETALRNAPRSLQAIATLSSALQSLNDAQWIVASTRDRRECVDRWVEVVRGWVELAPSSLEARRTLARALRSQALESDSQRVEIARAAVAEARIAYEQDALPDNALVLAECLGLEAEFLLSDPALASSLVDEARALLVSHNLSERSTTGLVLDVLSSHLDAARGDLSGALTSAISALNAAERAFAKQPRQLEPVRLVLAVSVAVVQRYMALGDRARAASMCDRALRVADPLLNRFPFAAKLVTWALALYVAWLDLADDSVPLDAQRRWLDRAEKLVESVAEELAGEPSFESARVRLAEHRARVEH